MQRQSTLLCCQRVNLENSCIVLQGFSKRTFKVQHYEALKPPTNQGFLGRQIHIAIGSIDMSAGCFPENKKYGTTKIIYSLPLSFQRRHRLRLYQCDSDNAIPIYYFPTKTFPTRSWEKPCILIVFSGSKRSLFRSTPVHIRELNLFAPENRSQPSVQCLMSLTNRG
jgi:hypothetical protein